MGAAFSRSKRRWADLDYSDDDDLVEDRGVISESTDQLAEHDDDDDDDEEEEDGGAGSGRPALRRARIRQSKLSFSFRPTSHTRTRTSSRVASTGVGDDQLMEDSDGVHGGSRSLRSRRQNAPSSISQHDDDLDELAQDPEDDDDSDGYPPLVRSDLQPQKMKRRRKKRSGWMKRASGNGADSLDDSIGYEPPRRSGRSNKNMSNMRELGMGDDESFVQDEEKAPAAPKISSVKEVFQPLTPEETAFKDTHSQICDTCNSNANGAASNRGPLIYCQGCSNSYHKGCLGQRAMRDHLVTKIGPEYFVLQCRFCVGVYQKKDSLAPDHALCQTCHEKGASCIPFSVKKTSKQEEQLRLNNGGEDPITPVDRQVINNHKNVLFRCTNCRRGYHIEHLPKPDSQDFMVDGNDSEKLRTMLLQEYSIEWKCKECIEIPAKVQSLVAWRPKDRDSYRTGQTFADFNQDAIEYLVKYEGLSYAHCAWQPGSWAWGATHGSMRHSFARRNEGENMLPKFDEKDAIPEEYLVPDVILAVTYADYRPSTKANDRANVHKVRKIYVKFLGLGYDAVVWDAPPKASSGYLYEAFLGAYDEYLTGKYFRDDAALKMRERLKEFRRLRFETGVEYKAQPACLQGGSLMGYQVEGLNWLLYNFHLQRNAILADEMGLGKTVQIVSLLVSLVQEQPKVWPFLVVVPNATCANWRRELKKWAPELRVVTYYGGKVPQTLSYQFELFPDNTSKMKAHVVVMSYDSAQDDQTRTLFKSVQWQGLIVDEGQRLKNEDNLLYGALRLMNIPFRVLLTGTPLQNNKRELFNLLQFVDSSRNARLLDEEYQELTAENIPKLHNLIRPYFLRRTKAATLKFLPPITRVIVPVTMSVLQEKLCKSIISKNSQLISAILAKGKTKVTERGSLNNILMQLRKCLCHPFLYSEAVEHRVDDAQTEFANLVEASSKLLLLSIMLPKLKERGHRVLMFSQFLGQLTIMEDFLTGLGMVFSRLDGNMSSLEKQRRIDAFNAPDSPLFAMLLSTRAGGVGINLATADTVIILDPDFNPHQDLQAVSRSHRIGQKNKVLCFQLMTKDSVEEKIMEIGRKKMALDHALIESMDEKEGEAGNDLESILKHGAGALFSNDKRDRINYDSASVDKLLDRSDKQRAEDVETQGETRSAESAFSFARVWANDEGMITEKVDDVPEPAINQGVWESILKEREEEARREAEANKEILGRGGRRRKVCPSSIMDLWMKFLLFCSILTIDHHHHRL